MRKSVEDIRPSDFEKFPVWEFVLDAEAESDSLLSPVRALPVDSLDNRVAGTQVRLANGALVPATLSNIDLTNPRRTQHFALLSIFDGQRWLHLSRYHDGDYASRGPHTFAAALNLPVEFVFPVAYDLRHCCIGSPLCVTGAIAAAPTEMLSQSEITALAIG